jgi:stringent starvation protein B
MSAVKGIFARENGQGMFFEASPEEVESDEMTLSENNEKNISKEVKKPSLKLVK